VTLHRASAREDSERIRERHALLYLDAKSSSFDFFCNRKIDMMVERFVCEWRRRLRNVPDKAIVKLGSAD